jgi:CHASE2 domain-containing sensor protein
LLLFAAAVAVLMSYAYESHALGSIEDWTTDKRFAVRGAHTPTDVAIVAIDDKALAALGRWPFPRRDHSRVLGRLAADTPSAIAFDVQFTEPSDPVDDNALIHGVAAADSSAGGGVVLATTEEDRQGRTDVLGGAAMLRQVGARVGNTLFEPDSSGGIRSVTWGSPTRDPQGRKLRPLETFSLVAAEIARGRRIPRFAGATPIAFVGPPGTIPTYSYSDVYAGRIAPAAFEGKVVVIGPAAASLGDVHSTPYGARNQMTGAEIEANAIETALHGFPLRPSRTRALLLIVLFSFLVPVASLFLRWRWCLLIAAIAAVLLLVAAQVAFDHGVMIVVTWPLVALALGTVAAGFLRPRRGRFPAPAAT